MTRRLIAVLFALVLARPAAAQDVVVVVNSANAASSSTKADVAALFLKHTTKWPDGSAAVCVDQGEGAAVREAFSKKVLGKSTSAVKAYWQHQIFSGHDLPPVEKSGDQAVLDFVRTNPGAVGYVSPGTSLGSGVKALTVE
jgi:ABC-type phosphate transport system substrate-binding protein